MQFKISLQRKCHVFLRTHKNICNSWANGRPTPNPAVCLENLLVNTEPESKPENYKRSLQSLRDSPIIVAVVRND